MKQINGYRIYLNEIKGKGSFGSVYIGANQHTGQKVAVKILQKSKINSNNYQFNALINEIKILTKIKNENIVSLHDAFESDNYYYIVLELCDKDLSDVIYKNKIIPQVAAKDYLLQIANGFLALVKQGIIHRDLKPANILMKNGKIKIADFGLSKQTQFAQKSLRQTIVGTALYWAPQVLQHEAYSSKCDVWALGCIFYEMLHGIPPWLGRTQQELLQNIRSKPLRINNCFSNNVKDFLIKCLTVREQKRMSWDQLFAHPIFNSFFVKQAKQNIQFQNKLSMIMSNLRFQVCARRLDLSKILYNLNGQKELCRNAFFKFLRMIDENITKEASDYIFMRTDINKNGKISFHQICYMMNLFKIQVKKN